VTFSIIRVGKCLVKAATNYVPPSFIGIFFPGMNDPDWLRFILKRQQQVNEYWLTTHDFEPLV